MTNILVFDTSLQGFSCGIYNAQTGDSHCVIRPRMRGQAEQLIPQIQHILSLQQITFNDIDLIATTSGPGSFTGLRVGLAVAKSFKTSLLDNVISINSHEVLASQFLYNSGKLQPSHILVLTDTQRRDFYVRYFAPGFVNSLHRAPAALSLTSDDIIALINDINAQPSKNEANETPNATIHLIGDGAPRFLNEYKIALDSSGSQAFTNIIYDDGYDLIDPNIFAQYAANLVHMMQASKDMKDNDVNNTLYDLSPIYLRDADISKPKKIYRVLKSS